MSELAFIELGSNIEPEEHLPLAIQRISELGRLLAVSSVYRNPAVGPEGQPEFMNMAALLSTKLPLQEVHRRLRAIEAGLGRKRTVDKYAPRSIDLDLCFYGDQVMEGHGIRIPNPDLLQRGYLAVTMAELAPDFVHPVTGRTLGEIAHRIKADSNLVRDHLVSDRVALQVEAISRED